MKKVLSLLACGVLAASFAGCSNSEESAPSNSEKTEEKQEKKEEQAPKTYGVGDTATVENIDITVNSTRVAQSTLGVAPEDGKQYFVMDISLANNQDDTFNSSTMLCYSLKDEDGREQDLAFDVDLNGSLDTEIGAGQKGAGEIAYTVPAEGALYLTFTPTFGDSVQIQVR